MREYSKNTQKIITQNIQRKNTTRKSPQKNTPLKYKQKINTLKNGISKKL